MENSRRSSSKLLRTFALQEKVSSQLTRVPEPLERDSIQSVLRTLTRIDKPTESFFSQLQTSRSTSVESSCSMRLPEIHARMEPSSATFSDLEESTAVSKSILDSFQSEELMMRPRHKVLMVLEKDALSITQWDVDSQNGGLSSRLVMDSHPRSLLLRLLTLLPDTDLFARRMDLSQSSSQRFCKMEHMILLDALKFLREFSQQSCLNFSNKDFSSKVFSLSQTWLPQELSAQLDQTHKRSLG